MKKPLTLGYIGEAEYIRLYSVFYNNEAPEHYVLEMSDDEVQKTTPKELKIPLFIPMTEDNFNVKVSRAYTLYHRQPEWRQKLLDFIEPYSTLEEVPVFEALESCYQNIYQSTEDKGEFRFAVNGDSSHLLDFNEMMTKIIKPIENVSGDVYYIYDYLDRYTIIREFIYNKIYILDLYDKETRTKFLLKLIEEKVACKLHFKVVREGSQMFDISTLSDIPRINILLNPESSPEDRNKAKG